MRSSIVFSAIVAVGLAVAACGSNTSGGDTAGVDTKAIAGQLRQNEARGVEDWASRDLNRVSAQYASDAVVMVAGAPPARGMDQIRSLLGPLLQDPNLQLQFTADKVDVAASGDLAYTRGAYTMRSTDFQTNQPRTESGSYVTAWRRQPDDSWKIVEDIITPGVPPAQPQAAAR